MVARVKSIVSGSNATIVDDVVGVAALFVSVYSVLMF